MDKNWIEIILYGYTFYIQADRVRDLNYVDGMLVNISQSQISMVNTFSNTTTYPYITCPSMRACNITVDRTHSEIVTDRPTYPDKINLNMLGALGYDQLLVGLLTILVALKLLWKK